MKLRATSLLLAILLLFGMVIPAYADSSREYEGLESEAEVEAGLDNELEEVEQEAEESLSPFYLGEEQLTTLEYELVKGTNYVTIESFLSALCNESMVEEEKGVVSASAVIVTEVVEVESTEEDIAAANVVEETLNIQARLGAYYVTANDRYLYVPGTVSSVNGKAALPIRTLAHMFNLTVGYDSATQHVSLEKQEGTDAFLMNGESYYDAEALYWLSHIIYAESGNQPLAGKIAVGNVVLNRVNSPKFPNTVEGVLFQKNQFSPASSGSIYRNPNAESVVAAKLVLDGACVLENALFFNRAGSTTTYAARNRAYVATIGAHAFYN